MGNGRGCCFPRPFSVFVVGVVLFRRVLSLVLIAVSAVVLLVPSVLNVKETWDNSRLSLHRYSQSAKDTSAPVMRRIMDDAREYNRELSGAPILDPWLHKYTSGNNPKYAKYLSQLVFPRTDVMATISIPKIGVRLPVFHGTSDSVLERGVGHMFGSALPVGGEHTHALFAGHSGLAELTVFDNITKLKNGDLIIIDVGDSKLYYRMVSSKIVDPNDTEGLEIQNGKDLITLITCYPYMVNTHRYEVTAERVAAPSGGEVTEAGFSVSVWGVFVNSPWWVRVFFVAGCVLAVFVVVASVRSVKMGVKRTRRKDVLGE